MPSKAHTETICHFPTRHRSSLKQRESDAASECGLRRKEKDGYFGVSNQSESGPYCGARFTRGVEGSKKIQRSTPRVGMSMQQLI
ncbi:hypothetical protein FF1_018729 [Malus domestica]